MSTRNPPHDDETDEKPNTLSSLPKLLNECDSVEEALEKYRDATEDGDEQ